MQQAIDTLQRWHESNETKHPFHHCVRTFEEILAVYVEGVRNRRRELCRLIGTENPRKEDLKVLAWTPMPEGGAWFKFENCWDNS